MKRSTAFAKPSSSFDVVTCRIAPHHFPDIHAAVQEMARVSSRLLVIEDNVFRGEHVEEAERLRDPTHVRCYSEDEWKGFVTDAGFEVEQVEHFDRRQSFAAWLERVDTTPDAAARIRDLLADGVDRVQRRHRVLQDHRDLAAAVLAHFGFAELQQVDAFELDLAADDLAARLRHQAQQRQAGHRLARTGLAHDAQRFARCNCEAYAVDRLHDAAPSVEVGAQILYLQ